MNKGLFTIPVFIMLLNSEAFSQQDSKLSFEWENIATLENADGTKSIGVAGAISAIFDQSLVIAGGANFPDKKPWEGGKKHYSDEIHILEKKESSFSWNKKVKGKLPFSIAYCGNTTTKQGIVYAGGENDLGLSKNAFLINFSAAKDQVYISALPDLPNALNNIFLCSIGNVVYAIGGDGPNLSSNAFLSLNLDRLADGWLRLADLPIALANSSVVVQDDAEGQKIYVIGGRAKDPSGISKLNNTLFIYSPKSNTWKKGAPISIASVPMNFSAGAALPLSDCKILIAGGDDGIVFNQIETYLSKIARATTAKEKKVLTDKKNQLVINHKGFNRGLLLYDTFTNTWSKIGELPFSSHVTTSAIKWGEYIVLPSGEIKPGIRTPNIMLGKPVQIN